jgi:hypothetical protein
LQDEVGDRLAKADRLAEIGLHQLAEVTGELHRPGAVEAIFVSGRGERLGAGPIADQEARGIAGRQLQQKKRDDRDPEQDREQLKEPVDEQREIVHVALTGGRFGSRRSPAPERSFSAQPPTVASSSVHCSEGVRRSPLIRVL